MIQALSKNQNWAKAAPWMAVVSMSLLCWFYSAWEPMFWALINIPLYLFHQTEEHCWPGGFKKYMNGVIYNLPEGEEALTDEKVFWINIIFVWVAFLVFGLLAFINLGFGLVIVVFSIMNCLAHIVQGIKRKEWNPGLVMASAQFLISVYAAHFVTRHGLTNATLWWIGTVIFSAGIHAILFKVVMGKK
jgi:hypothetical protein